MNLIEKCPKHIQDKIEEILNDSTGYWVYLKKGWHFKSTDCHIAHEYSWAEIRKEMKKNNIEKVEDDWD